MYAVACINSMRSIAEGSCGYMPVRLKATFRLAGDKPFMYAVEAIDEILYRVTREDGFSRMNLWHSALYTLLKGPKHPTSRG